VVVTGSYHAAVFALAQGIPVVALVSSTYYEQKFAGLSELFAGGCTPVALDTRVDVTIPSTVIAAWDRAPDLRRSLLQAAAWQVEQGRAAYQRLAAIAGRGADGATDLDTVPERAFAHGSR
jgi:colanic acid/amylovoran biosynthesis protein